MITLSILGWLVLIITSYRLYKKADFTISKFNPFDGTFLDYMGFMFGLAAAFITVLSVIITYLP